MATNSKHPKYAELLPDWELCRDSYRGERAVKERGTIHLPATAGMIADGAQTVNTTGWHAYQAYLARAVFHEYYAMAVETMLGLLWAKPPVIELPGTMEDMLERITPDGNSIEQLLRTINEHQLVVGRLGLLLDLPENPDQSNPLPYVAVYPAEQIINWDNGRIGMATDETLNLVVLDETEEVRSGTFQWQREEKYRVLILGDPEDTEVDGTGLYRQGVFKGSGFNEEELIEPSIRGKTLNKIPFVFVNTKTTEPKPDDPPLIGLARLCMAIYRGEADYRQALFMQSQDTLVIRGGDEEKTYRIGAGATIIVPVDGGAEFIGTNSQGLPEMRQALENDKAQAMNKSGQLVDIMSRQKESGEALKTRIAAQTATLNQIATTGAEALKRILRSAAEWLGANPDEVVVEPNLDFDNVELTGKELIDLMAAKNMGAPISMNTVHEVMQNKGLTVYTLDEELELINEELPTIQGGPGTITNPDDPNYDPNMDPNYDPEKDPNSSRFKDPNEDHKKQLELKAAGKKKEPPEKKTKSPGRKVTK